MQPIFRRLIYIWLVTLGSQVYAQDDITEDIVIKFLSVDRDGNARVVEDPGSQKSIGIFLYKSEKFFRLELKNTYPFDIWINGRMYYAEQTALAIDRAYLFQLSASDTAFITLHSSREFSDLTARIYYDEMDPISLVNPISGRAEKEHKDMMIVATVAFGLVLGLFRFVIPDGFSFQLMVFSSKMSRGRDSNVRELTPTKVLETILVSVLIAFAMWFLFSYDREAKLHQSLLTWIRYVVVIGLGLFAKYYFIRMISYLYGISQIAVQQFTEFVRVALLSSILITAIFLMKYWFGFYAFESKSVIWQYYFLLVQVGFLVYFFLRVTVGTTVKKLSIFSYLCTTEILGAFLVAMIFTK